MKELTLGDRIRYYTPKEGVVKKIELVKVQDYDDGKDNEFNAKIFWIKLQGVKKLKRIYYPYFLNDYVDFIIKEPEF
jgi:hypothetical protein